ncbi:uncharacterized protein LOC101234503 isoform X2 [Hydra vulgaris]|uniref:Uncharacterized protein LOC101234503 isoform X2 n=1 Tax=Hydra vulgaris TaxID=6087 RepID=A0ABM4CCK8_HYDVU
MSNSNSNDCFKQENEQTDDSEEENEETEVKRETEEGKSNDEISDDHSLHCITYSTLSSSPNSISWSADESLAIITDKRIYVLKIVSSCMRKKPGTDFGLKFETTVVENIKPVSYDTGVDTKSFCKRINGSFLQRQSYLLDSATFENDNFCVENKNSYCQLRWSPLSSTKDGRCILATLSSNGNVYIHSLKQSVGKWNPILNVSNILFDYVRERNWLDFRTCNEQKHTIEKHFDFNCEHFEQHRFRKHLLFTTSICWCPSNIPCISCFQKSSCDRNVFFNDNFNSYIKCKHSKLVFLTASKNGFLFLWLVTFSLIEENQHNAKVMLWWKTDIMWPVSTVIFQYSVLQFLVAVGFNDGCIMLYHVHADEENNRYQIIQVVNIWPENDLLRVSFLEWINTNNGILQLVAAKEREIIVFKIIVQEGQIIFLGCESAPSCHSSPITSLQVINNKFVLTSSFTATQYFDIDNKIVPVCEKNILRGFKCLGASVDCNMTLLAQVSCPNKLLLHQTMFIKQMEISFYPFLSIDALATKVLDGSMDLSMNVREFFAVSSTDNFLLPTVLHKYCDEPIAYDGLTRQELQIYLCFNKLRHMQLESSRAILTREEVESGEVKGLHDPVLQKLNDVIERLFIQETLNNGLYWTSCGLVPTSTKSILILSLMADFLWQADCIAPDISKRCYNQFGDHQSLYALEVFEKQRELPSTSSPSNKCSEPVSNDMAQWKCSREKCAFCGLEIFLDSLNHAICPNKHCSLRCSLTLQVCLANTYRKCTGCNRIALDKVLDGQLSLEAIFLNVDVCPYCGCKFVYCYSTQ